MSVFWFHEFYFNGVVLKHRVLNRYGLTFEISRSTHFCYRPIPSSLVVCMLCNFNVCLARLLHKAINRKCQGAED